MRLASVLVCTRDRPELAAQAVRSLLASEGVDLELVIVDQSRTDTTERALEEFRNDQRLRYARTAVQGKPAALNVGLQLAQREAIICTDDDCEAAPGWVAAMHDLLLGDDRAALAFCTVTAAAHDPAAGYVPVYQVKRTRTLDSAFALTGGQGIGAGMALRRSAVLALGGFDESIGPGAHHPSGDDCDITLRLLLSGWRVRESAELSIVHHGFRPHSEARAHSRRHGLGLGALTAKPLRAGRLSALPVAVYKFWAHALSHPLIDLLHFRRPRGLARLLGFVQGFAQGLTTPVDRARLVFIEPPAALPAPTTGAARTR